MLINGIELSSLGAQLHDRVLTSNTVETVQDWLEGDIQPTFIRQQDKFKNIYLEFLITEQDEETAFLVMSKLAAMLRKATIVFDDMDLLFDVVLEGKTQQKRLKNGNFILAVNLLSDYAKGGTEVYTTDARATDYFYLNVLYYQKGNILLSTDRVLIKAAQFNDELIMTFDKLGIDVNKYRPDYYDGGKVSNFEGRELTYENLRSVQTLIINYSPTTYYKEVEYFLQNEEGGYISISLNTVSFTKELIDNSSAIGQVIDLTVNKPNGYRARTNFISDFTFDNLLAFSPLEIYYDKIENERSRDIVVNYYVEEDNQYNLSHSQIVNVREGNVVNGTHLNDIINVNAYKPERYHGNGICEEYNLDSLVDFDTLQTSYDIKYPLLENIVLVEYYLGTYPNWSRITTSTYKIKYHSSFDNSADIIKDMGIDLDRYLTETYNSGAVHNLGSISSFEDVLNLGVLQVYYVPKDYTITVSYNQEDIALGAKEVIINDYMFIGNPVLSEIIDINAMRPEGFIYSEDLSYDGEVSLSALTAASPIIITYVPVDVVRTKSVLIKYKQELASTYATINTSVVTIEESAVGGGIKLSDLIDLNAYKPDYYDAGIIDGASSTSVLLFDEIQGTYDVLYLASVFDTPVRYYTDEISNYNWIGSESLNYRIIDFTTSTTLIDLGLNVNAFKPYYCGDGIVDYQGAITFAALMDLDAINVVYLTEEEPTDPDGIDYPHRILFLQHNDMGGYESNFPAWTLNHAYINTGVTAQDMSKLTVQCEVVRVFDTEPLYNVNVDDAYLFGSMTPQGSYYIKYVNNTAFKPESQLTGVNTFNVAAGYGTPELVVEESSSEGFSRNTGIMASTRRGYSYATLTYTNLVQSNSAPMNVPLYLFACNQNGHYKGGIAGVGIAGCKIYYDDVLIRDFVPVQFYDKIGDKIAPSNCLYDKITQTFFEDARGLDSFNIMDDPEHTDTNPEHMIGCCYVNYYKDTTLFNSSIIWFRGSDFVDQEFILNEKLFIDYYQPQFYGSGVITNLNEIGDITFNNLKNKVINVKYESIGYNVVVNYWKDNKDNEANKLATETITLTEKDFLQVPTFGDLIPLLKYKPDSYKVNYNYPETKVTLNRVMQHSPYDIIYIPVEEPKMYSTIVSFYRKRFGLDTLHPLNSYELVGQKAVQLDETQFADGVYIEDYIGQYFNEFYPSSPIEDTPFYKEGTPYEWYLDDEMIDTPDKLKAEYLVSYEPVPVYIDVNYYTDVVEEENLIASTTWEIAIDKWPDDGQFYLVDELPNSYTDKYKPVICGGGRINEPEKVYTFETLVAQGEISIIYDTLEEPHDPESKMWPSKVMWFKRGGTWTTVTPPTAELGGGAISSINITTPYFDLGYTPKEIGRLRIETKAYALNTGAQVNVNRFGYAGDSYSYFLGYYGALDWIVESSNLGTENAADKIIMSGLSNFTPTSKSNFSINSSGWFAFKGHTAKLGGFTYTSAGPPLIDGHPAWNNNNNSYNPGYNRETVREMLGGFRRGYFVTQGDNWEDIPTYGDYYAHKDEGYGDGHNFEDWATAKTDQWLTGNDKNGDFGASHGDRDDLDEEGKLIAKTVAFNPLTMTIDAYNDYMEIYDYRNSASPEFANLQNKDVDLFTRRCKPKGSLSLWITTNPDTGKVNWRPAEKYTYLSMDGIGHIGGLGQIHLQNPWDDNFNPSVIFTQQVVVGKTEDGLPIYENMTTTRTIRYANYQVPTNPCVERSLIWYIKVWDRDRLVRDLIPVNEGDLIYDYVSPVTGLFDKVTETFFGNQNTGGTYQYRDDKFPDVINTVEVKPEDVTKVHVSPDPTVWGNVVVNYYDDKNNFLGNQYVEIPVHYKEANTTIYEICHHNDFKPNEFYHDGMIDVDLDFTKPTDATLKAIYDAGSINVYYKLITFTKTVVYYQGNSRVGSKDLFYSIEDIDKAENLADLGIDVNLYASEDYKPGRIVFNESVIAEDDIKAFIDASSPIVVYDKLDKEEAPNLLYVDYYREGAYDDTLITLDEEDPNYLNCDLEAVVLNPKGAIKYLHHYHTALYEDEKQDYFIAYQVDVKANYVPVHKGPARRYRTLAIIVDKGRYTVVEERAGWGRLKEYPTGWIMLSYTEPVTGPGQNPDYDEPGIADVTVPFGEHITINRLTIDRLWGYSPELASWIKTEEISYDQSGKLYNGLATKVVHLDELDWTSIDDLTDMEIYVDLYQLKYHNASGYVYDGEYTQAAFSDLHSIDIVYPETIYAYNCIYYTDTKAPENEVGRVSFSCSMSDWNPDWDTFIETSWKAKEVPMNGEGKIVADARVNLRETPSLDAKVLIEVGAERTIILTGTRIAAEGREWYPARFNKYNGYVDAEYVNVIREHSTYLEKINPTLYRNTELTLTWDYFGVERDLFKPEVGNYDNGIYLWNPRTFENKDIRFTFEELVTTGVQEILYVHSMEQYKLVTSTGAAPYCDFSLDFTPIPDTLGTIPGVWDVEWKFGNDFRDNGVTATGIRSHSNIGAFLGGSISVPYSTTFYPSDRFSWTGHHQLSSISPKNLPTSANNWKYVITNISNKRNATSIYSYGDDITGFQTPNYVLRASGGEGKTKEVKESDVEITPILDLRNKEFNQLRKFKHIAEISGEYQLWKKDIENKVTDEEYNDTEQHHYYYLDWNGKTETATPHHWTNNGIRFYDGNDLYTPLKISSQLLTSRHEGSVDKPATSIVEGTVTKPFYYIKIWKNYYLEHYYIPVARGTWLADGRQIQYNTLYDVITNTICEGYTEEDTLKMSGNQIFKVGDEVLDKNIYTPFETWSFNYTDCNYTVKTTDKVQGYKYPDVLSTLVVEYPINTVIPVRRYTADAANNVQGEWYYNGSVWFQSTNTTILPTDEYAIVDINPVRSVAIKGDTINKEVKYKGYINPSAEGVDNTLIFKSEHVVPVYFECNDFYWTELSGWIPKAYTEDNYIEIDTKYVVSIGNMKVYSHPIANDIYRVSELISGDRVTATKKLVKDENWKFIGTGWIDTYNAAAEIA